MTKSDLVNAVARKTGLKKKDAAVVAVFDSIAAALANGEEVKLVGFSSFTVRQRAARSARNIRTGEQIAIPATKAPAFRPASTLKEAVAHK